MYNCNILQYLCMWDHVGLQKHYLGSDATCGRDRCDHVQASPTWKLSVSSALILTLSGFFMVFSHPPNQPPTHPTNETCEHLPPVSTPTSATPIHPPGTSDLASIGAKEFDSYSLASALFGPPETQKATEISKRAKRPQKSKPKPGPQKSKTPKSFKSFKS